MALVAGLVSFFTPCSLPLMPGYLSYVAGAAGLGVREPRSGRWGTFQRIVAGAVLFVLGFATVFTSYGLALGSLGSRLLVHQDLICASVRRADDRSWGSCSPVQPDACRC